MSFDPLGLDRIGKALGDITEMFRAMFGLTGLLPLLGIVIFINQVISLQERLGAGEDDQEEG